MEICQWKSLIIFPFSGSGHPDMYLYETDHCSQILWLRTATDRTEIPVSVEYPFQRENNFNETSLR